MWESDCEVACSSWLLFDYQPHGSGLSAGRQRSEISHRASLFRLHGWRLTKIGAAASLKVHAEHLMMNRHELNILLLYKRGSDEAICKWMGSCIQVFFWTCACVVLISPGTGLCTPHGPWIICYVPLQSLSLNNSNDFGSKFTAVKDDLRKTSEPNATTRHAGWNVSKILSFHCKNQSGKKPVELHCGRGSLKTQTHARKRLKNLFCCLQRRWYCTDLKLPIDKRENTKARLPKPINGTAKHVFHHGKPSASFCLHLFYVTKKPASNSARAAAETTTEEFYLLGFLLWSASLERLAFHHSRSFLVTPTHHSTFSPTRDGNGLRNCVTGRKCCWLEHFQTDT